MPRLWIGSLAAVGLLLAGGSTLAYGKQRETAARTAVDSTLFTKLLAARHASSDLEVVGELIGLPPGTTRYITREDLLALPQVTYTVADDSNFTGPTKITGVLLEELVRSLSAAPQSDMVVAICDDKYRANYPRAYVAAHHPLLVLTINGQPPSDWPKSSEGQGYDMGPYLISHPKFTPASKTSSYADEPQIPWGVVRIELRDENAVFGAIIPRGLLAGTPAVKAGYRVAQQNCFRCHNMGREGGQKSGTPWLVLSAWATTSPDYFAVYVRNPQAKDPHAQMPGNSAYDDRTIDALTAYFRTFISTGGDFTWGPERKGKP
jgi:mono/diheme cytochrome c family protein